MGSQKKQEGKKRWYVSKVHCNLRPEVLEGLGCSTRREGAEERGATGHILRHPGMCSADLWEAPKPEDCFSHGEAAAETKMKGFSVHSVLFGVIPWAATLGHESE